MSDLAATVPSVLAPCPLPFRDGDPGHSHLLTAMVVRDGRYRRLEEVTRVRVRLPWCDGYEQVVTGDATSWVTGPSGSAVFVSCHPLRPGVWTGQFEGWLPAGCAEPVVRNLT